MVAMKRKNLSKLARNVAKNANSKLKETSEMASKKKLEEEEQEEEYEHEEEEEETDEEIDDEEDEAEEGEDEGKKEQLSEEAKWKQQEKETLAARKKELKSMPANEMKELVLSKGLEKGNKEEMIETLAAYEGKRRAEVHAHEVKLRAVVVNKKEEFEAKSIPELTELCADIGITGRMTKEERVTQLLRQWQKDDGVSKALAQRARDAREAELVSKDKAVLRKLCEKKRIDPFVKEVLVVRIVKRENEMGRFSRPKIEKETEGPSLGEKTDMVDVILAHESNRKKEAELKKQQEDAAASKRKELKAMTVEELKKALVKKGASESTAVTGKKEEMVEALLAAIEQEEKVAARRLELKALGTEGLKKLLVSKKLETGKVSDMIETLIEHDAKIVQNCREYGLKVAEAAAKKKEELDAKTGAELKDLCNEKGLQVGGSKEERIDRLVEEAKVDGEIDKVVTALARDERKVALFAMDTPSLVKHCDALGADPLVKEIMVERILDHENETSTEPAAKKARTLKN